jgi:hypothetical protein
LPEVQRTYGFLVGVGVAVGVDVDVAEGVGVAVDVVTEPAPAEPVASGATKMYPLSDPLAGSPIPEPWKLMVVRRNSREPDCKAFEKATTWLWVPATVIVTAIVYKPVAEVVGVVVVVGAVGTGVGVGVAADAAEDPVPVEVDVEVEVDAEYGSASPGVTPSMVTPLALASELSSPRKTSSWEVVGIASCKCASFLRRAGSCLFCVANC